MMFESFPDDRWRVKGTKQKPVRLFLEELEGRCLLSGGINPIGGITVGPDGNIWFLEPAKIGELNPTTGIIKEFDLPSGPLIGGQIVFDKNGNLWFSRTDRIDTLNPTTGAVQEFSLPTGESAQSYIAVDGGQRIWFSDSVKREQFLWGGQNVVVDAAGIGQLDPATGEIRQLFTSVDWDGGPHFHYGQVAAGADGNIWMAGTWWDDTAAPFLSWLDRIDIFGDKQLFGGGVEGRITVAEDGSVWYPSFDCQIVRVDAGIGVVQVIAPKSEFQVTDFSFNSLAIGDDGRIWGLAGGQVFSVSNGESLQQLTIPGGIRVLDLAAGKDGNLWFTEANAISEYNPTTGAFQFFDAASKSASQSTPGTSATGAFIAATAGIDFTTAVASFTTLTPIPSTGAAYQATINWGDGTTSSLVLTVTDNATYDVTAGHTYQSAGTYSIKETIGNYNPANPLGDNAVTVFSTANVQPFDFNPFG